MENKRKHLEFIQSIIARMSGNSFLLKRWAAALGAALVAVGGAKTSSQAMVMVAVPTTLLWILDAYYLNKERAYRRLYDRVRVLPEEAIDFDLDTGEVEGGQDTWSTALTSKTLVVYYLSLVGVIVIVAAFLD